MIEKSAALSPEAAAGCGGGGPSASAKATMHRVAPGTSIREKLHSEEKYLGTNMGAFSVLPPEEEEEGTGGEDDEELPNKFPIMDVAVETRLDVLFLVESSVENTCIVPWLLEAATKLVSGLNMKTKS